VVLCTIFRAVNIIKDDAGQYYVKQNLAYSGFFRKHSLKLTCDGRSLNNVRLNEKQNIKLFI